MRTVDHKATEEIDMRASLSDVEIEGLILDEVKSRRRVGRGALDQRGQAVEERRPTCLNSLRDSKVQAHQWRNFGKVP